MKLTRCFWGALLALLLLQPGCNRLKKTRDNQTQPERLPNVLVITIDTLRADRLGCYGYKWARTPHIDQLAREGVRVNHDATAVPVTLPSHTTIFTGLYPPAHGVRDNGTFRVPDEAVTLAERLKQQGYRTQAFVSAAVLHHRYNLNQGFDGYDDELFNEDDPPMFMIRERPGARTTDRVIQWLDEYAKKPQSPPFFMWMHLFDPHQPYRPEKIDRIGTRTLYDAEIAGVDRQIGRLMKSLESHELLDNTIIVFTSDHGEGLGEHKEKTHAIFIYETTIRVPLILRYPSALPQGFAYEGRVRSVDVTPTILGLLHLPIDNVQGADLSKVFAKRVGGPKLLQYSESKVTELGFGMAPLAGVRDERFTYVRAPRSELYDRQTDPRELSNLLEQNVVTETAKTQAATLDVELERILRDSDRFALKSTAQPLDAETIEMLQALGYLGEEQTRKQVEGLDPKDGIEIYDALEDSRHLVRDGKFEEAVQTLTKLLKKVPKHVAARNILALCQVRLGKRDKAKREYLRSLKDFPNQHLVLTRLGRIYVDEGKLDTAETYYKKALEVNPDFVEAMLALGYLELLRKNPEGAKTWYQAALKENADSPNVYIYYADFYFRDQKYELAKEWYDKALAVQRDSFPAALQAGVCAHRLGRYDEAKAYFRRAGEARADTWKPDYNLACSEALSGNAQAAVQHLKKAVEKGFHGEKMLLADEDLKSLHELPAFAALRDQLRTKAKQDLRER